MNDIRSTLKLKRLLFSDQKISTIVISKRIVYNNQSGLDLNNKTFIFILFILELYYYSIFFPKITKIDNFSIKI